MGGRRGNLGTSPETLGGEAGRTLWVTNRHQPQQLQRACYRVGMKRHPALPLSSKMRLQPLAAGHARRKSEAPGRRNEPFSSLPIGTSASIPAAPALHRARYDVLMHLITLTLTLALGCAPLFAADEKS